MDENNQYLRGMVATRHRGKVTDVALLPSNGGHRWWLASRGADNTLRIVSSDELKQKEADSGRLLSGRVVAWHEGLVRGVELHRGCRGEGVWLGWGNRDHTSRFVSLGEFEQPNTGEFERYDTVCHERPRGTIATSHNDIVLSVALLPGNCREQSWLASGGWDRTSRIVCFGELEQLRGGDDNNQRRGTVATRHARCVNSVALLRGSGSKTWWLASGSSDNTARVISSSDLESLGADDGNQLRGIVATRHRAEVTSVTLLAGVDVDHWWLASGSRDGTVRIVSSAEFQRLGADDGVLPRGQVAVRHSGWGKHRLIATWNRRRALVARFSCQPDDRSLQLFGGYAGLDQQRSSSGTRDCTATLG